MSEIIKNRYEFVVLFDVENGNPNGDPDAGNMPRIDAETGYGIVTDVCIKRKIRNYVEVVKDDCEGYKIYVKVGAVLNKQHETAYIGLGIDPKDEKASKENREPLRDFMCKNFFDIRAFGAVMTTKVNCGQVRGPIQINFARSIDPIVAQEITITRMAVTTEKDAENKTNEMGRKHIVPYALYRTEGYISAKIAKKTTGFSEEDLELLWDAILNMFEHDHSAARGKMAVRKLVVFKHSSDLGNAPSHLLFELISITKNDSERPARKYSDYNVEIDMSKVPEGVSVIEKL
ncbi:MAG: type I-C CRISPR-associated protein Cas7/Csd2 [Clostridia bacterium]|nr:type I-C CRISPR-associated protein Cas7/Csd2 [Clostridia bacterium]